MPIVIDTSALVAVYRREADANRYWDVMDSDADLWLPVSCYLECVMVLRSAAGSRQWLDELIAQYRIGFFGYDAAQIRIAADAFERFGRGTGHPAKLNFGDCLAYAAAKALGAPLLFKGEDFAKTDLQAAPASR